MEALRFAHRMLAYDHWGNEETLAALRAASAPPPRGIKLLGHVIGAQHVWLARLQQSTTNVPVWPDFGLPQCEMQLRDLQVLWHDFWKGATADLLSHAIAYKNTKGEPWRSTVQDILTHLALHGSYHRGQIALEMRVATSTPASTDYILCVRQGLLDMGL